MGTVLKFTKPVDPKLPYFTAYVHETKAVKTRPRLKFLGYGNDTKIPKNMAPFDPKLTYFTAYVHGT